jgi:hypothetical protein
MYNKAGEYQVHWFAVALPDPNDIIWYYPNTSRKGEHRAAGHLNGDDRNGGRLFEWYGDSGGQLKYYPLATSAKWASARFSLEPISEEVSAFGLLSKVKMYFPARWATIAKTAEEGA